MSQAKNKSNETQLVTLPPEVFERVAQSLRADDVCQLRLVSREAASKVLETYKETCFHTKSLVLCDPDHMQAGIAAAKNITVGPSIKEVRIYINRNRSLNTEDGEDPKWPFQIALLTKFFTCLESVSSREIALKLCELPEADNTSDHFPKGIARGMVGETTLSRLEDIDPLVNILAAVSATSLVLRDLYVGEDHWAPPAHILQNKFQRHCRDVIFQSLKRLDMRIWTCDEDGIQQFATLVANASQLESLKMGLYAYGARYIDAGATDAGNLMDAMRATQFRQLRELQLDFFTLQLGPFVEFARKQPKLKNIKLTVCLLKNGRELLDGKEGFSVQEELRRLTGIENLEDDGFTESAM